MTARILPTASTPTPKPKRGRAMQRYFLDYRRASAELSPTIGTSLPSAIQYIVLAIVRSDLWEQIPPVLAAECHREISSAHLSLINFSQHHQVPSASA